jgi:hypothetical protein
MNEECHHYIGPRKGVSKDAPGLKYDGDKPMFFTLPMDVLWGVVDAMMFGIKKYARDNWRKIEDKERFLNAMMRHLKKYQSGIEIDDDSGLHNITLFCWNAICYTWHVVYKPKSLEDFHRRL